MDNKALITNARGLMGKLVGRCSDEFAQGSLTLTVYDTAWVSMIMKWVDGEPQWLFPESFRYIMDRQMSDGGWESYASDIDGILNSMAALLAMRKHGNLAGKDNCKLPPDFDARVSSARAYLQKKLEQWDVDATVHVGFEVLIPAHLLLLEQEGCHFEFPGQSALMKLYAEKSKKFDPEISCYAKQTTWLHSLEALIGKINFDRVSHLKTFGSMMASPSSTAAYLMNCSCWDADAENYLRMVISKNDMARGGVPSAFPIPIFELTWVSL